MEVWVTAIARFDHYGSRDRGERFRVSKQIAAKLAARRLVTIGDEATADEINPTAAAGARSSVSPVGHQSEAQTSSASASGATPTEARSDQPDSEPDSELIPPGFSTPAASAPLPVKRKRGRPARR